MTEFVFAGFAFEVAEIAFEIAEFAFEFAFEFVDFAFEAAATALAVEAESCWLALQVWPAAVAVSFLCVTAAFLLDSFPC